MEFKVIRFCLGIIEERFVGSYNDCLSWISRRGDSGIASYFIERCNF